MLTESQRLSQQAVAHQQTWVRDVRGHALDWRSRSATDATHAEKDGIEDEEAVL